jgi:hypothetical protein
MPHVSEWEVPKPLVPAAAKARKGMKVEKVILEPVQEDMKKGVADVPAVEAVKRPGWMIEKEGGAGQSLLRPAEEGEKVVLYLHSGQVPSHRHCNAQADEPEPTFSVIRSRQALRGVWRETSMSDCLVRRTRTLYITSLICSAANYRKVLDVPNAHPGPLLDALAGYLYLVRSLNFDPRNITVAGDSAGGHLSLSLTRYLDSINLPLPGRMALSSPWCDFTASSKQGNFQSQTDNYETDYIPYLGDLAIEAGMRHYTLASRRDAWFSPCLASTDDWRYLAKAEVEAYLMRGTKEMLSDEVGMVAKAMKEAGVKVTLRDVSDHCGCCHEPVADVPRTLMACTSVRR